ncbi:uncharacterized protein ACWYII_022746 [Salvelinus alpinus]
MIIHKRTDRRPHGGGRGRVLTDQQEWAVVDMVRARNDIRLYEIKQAIEENDDPLANVTSISLPTMAHLLKRHQVSMKHIYLMPFERNNDRVKQLQAKYVQRVMVLDAAVKWASTWTKLSAVGGNSSSNGQPSKCLDNVGGTSPCTQLFLRMVW